MGLSQPQYASYSLKKFYITSISLFLFGIFLGCSDLQKNGSIRKKNNAGIITITTKNGDTEVSKGIALSRKKAMQLINVAKDSKSGFLKKQLSGSTIKGHVIDKLNGNNIVGANVIWVGHNYGAITDSTGKYTLHIPSNTGGEQLLCSYIGYQPLQTPFLPNYTVTVDFELVHSTNISN